MSKVLSPVSEGAKALLDFYSQQQRSRYEDLRDQFSGVTSVDGGKMHDLHVGPINTKANWDLISNVVSLLPAETTSRADWHDAQVIANDPYLAKQVTANALWERHKRRGWFSSPTHTPRYIVGRGIGQTAVERLPRREPEGWRRRPNSTSEVLLASVGGGALRTVRLFDDELAVALNLSARAAGLDYPEGELERMYVRYRNALEVDSHAPGSMIYDYTTGRRFDPDPLTSTFMTRRVDTFQTTPPYGPDEVEARIADKGMHAQPGYRIDSHEFTDNDMDNFGVIQGLANLAVAFHVVDETRELLGQYGETRQPSAAEILMYRQA